jgi:hypothetical protein
MLEWSIDIHSAHITPFTLKTHIQTQHFFCILIIPAAATCPEINGNSKHKKKKLHPTWWVSSLFCNFQTSIRTNNHKSSNSDYSCSVNFSDRIVTLDLSLQHLWSSIRMNNNKSSYSDYSCLIHFYNRNANTGPQFVTSKLNLELVGGTSSFTL